jgi:hypothetical protein
MFDAMITRVVPGSAVNSPASAAHDPTVAHATGPAPTLNSDGGLIEVVGQALRATGYPALRDIQVEMCRGIVVL